MKTWFYFIFLLFTSSLLFSQASQAGTCLNETDFIAALNEEKRTDFNFLGYEVAITSNNNCQEYETFQNQKDSCKGGDEQKIFEIPKNICGKVTDYGRGAQELAVSSVYVSVMGPPEPKTANPSEPIEDENNKDKNMKNEDKGKAAEIEDDDKGKREDEDKGKAAEKEKNKQALIVCQEAIDEANNCCGPNATCGGSAIGSIVDTIIDLGSMVAEKVSAYGACARTVAEANKALKTTDTHIEACEQKIASCKQTCPKKGMKIEDGNDGTFTLVKQEDCADKPEVSKKKIVAQRAGYQSGLVAANECLRKFTGGNPANPLDGNNLNLKITGYKDPVSPANIHVVPDPSNSGSDSGSGGSSSSDFGSSSSPQEEDRGANSDKKPGNDNSAKPSYGSGGSGGYPATSGGGSGGGTPDNNNNKADSSGHETTVSSVGYSGLRSRGARGSYNNQRSTSSTQNRGRQRNSQKSKFIIIGGKKIKRGSLEHYEMTGQIKPKEKLKPRSDIAPSYYNLFDMTHQHLKDLCFKGKLYCDIKGIHDRIDKYKKNKKYQRSP